jgi:hypothetical protein
MPLDRPQPLELGLVLAPAQALVDALLHREVQALLAAEIVEDQALGDARAARDALDAAARVAAGGELAQRRLQDLLARAGGVAAMARCGGRGRLGRFRALTDCHQGVSICA